MIKILVTGASGMIGFHLLKSLSLFPQFKLYAIDKSLYSINEKTYSLERYNQLNTVNPSIIFNEIDLISEDSLLYIQSIAPDIIIHLAADAGISESFKNPNKVLNNNHLSFINILESIRKFKPDTKLLYASSSSVYGKTLEEQIETNKNLLPTSSYGLSKLMNEQIAQLYFQNYNISSIGLRFFTVYGEYNRKDMLMHYLLESFVSQKQVTLYNNGLMQRDFTYVHDVVQSILAFVLSNSIFGHEVFNIGGTGSATLNQIVDIMKTHFNISPNILKDSFIPVYDPLKTFCNNSKLLSQFPELKFTPLDKGIANLVQWYKTII